MDDKKLRKLKNIARIEEPDMALLQALEEIDDIKEQIEEKIPALKEIIQQVKGKDGIDGKDYIITDKDIDFIISEVKKIIPIPTNGKDGISPTIDYKKIVKDVLSNVKLPKNGTDGKDAIIDYDKIITDASRTVLESILIPEETGESIIQKINEDKTSIIKKEKVEGLSEIEKMARLGSINAQNSHIWQGVSEVRVNEIVDKNKLKIINSLDLSGYFKLDQTTPQQIIETLTAGENVTAGQICYLKSDGKYWKAQGNAEATTKGRIVMATASISANATGVFLIKGKYTTSSLTAGATYFISTSTAGAMTLTTPTTGNFIRVLGYAESTTVFNFDPSKDYGEVA